MSGRVGALLRQGAVMLNNLSPEGLLQNTVRSAEVTWAVSHASNAVKAGEAGKTHVIVGVLAVTSAAATVTVNYNNITLSFSVGVTPGLFLPLTCLGAKGGDVSATITVAAGNSITIFGKTE